MSIDALHKAIVQVPAGAWAVGVSGGADSVALLSLLRARADLALTAVHLDHQTRRGQSTEDASFVANLARQWNLPCVVGRRSELEAELKGLPANRSARYRTLRMELFGRVVKEFHLRGVILGHHADDQAETVLQRLLRGTGVMGLGGIQQQACVRGMLVLHPLLSVRRQTLREYLRKIGQTWREDASNVSAEYQRNRVRQVLEGREELTAGLLELGDASAQVARWIEQQAPPLGEEFDVRDLQGVPAVLGMAAARRWLLQRGTPPEQVSTSVVRRLLVMAEDAAAPSRQHFPGGLLVRRSGGKILLAS
jgi:tRNA(Ile)-lysidine synthase